MTDEEKKNRIAAVFDTVAARYDTNHFFSISAKNLIQCLEDSIPSNGSGRMLDLSTGTGNIALLAAKRWPDLEIEAVDLSAEMLNQAQKKAAALKSHRIHFLKEDVENIKYPAGYFDAATCAYGLFFFPRMAETFKKIMTALKPGAPFVFSSFSKLAFTPFSDLFTQTIKTYGIEIPKLADSRLQSPEEINALCETCGIDDIEIHFSEIRYRITPDAWWSLLDSAGYKGLLDQLGPERLPEFKSRHLDEVIQFSHEGKLLLIADSFYGIARQ